MWTPLLFNAPNLRQYFVPEFLAAPDLTLGERIDLRVKLLNGGNYMSRKTFTPEQVQALNKNRYTLSASPSMIKFTDEFKELLWKAYTGSKNYTQVFLDAGYDPEVLGKSRIYNLVNKVARQHEAALTGFAAQSDENRSLEQRVKILEFELSAVKKILHLTSKENLV